MSGKSLQLMSTAPEPIKQLTFGRKDCLFNKRDIFSSTTKVPSSV
jgi:hypothetical protein